jgi:hypothetical protein
MNLSPEERHRFELASAAEARLQQPQGYPREMRRIVRVLEPQEPVRDIFHIFLGKRGARTGLAVDTGERFVFVPRRLLSAKTISLPYEEISRVEIEEQVLGICELRLCTDQRTYYFWQGNRDRQHVRRLREVIENELRTRQQNRQETA